MDERDVSIDQGEVADVENVEQAEQFDFEPIDFDSIDFGADEDPGAPGEDLQRLMLEKERAEARASQLERLLAAQSANQQTKKDKFEDEDDDEEDEYADPYQKKTLGIMKKLGNEVLSMREQNAALQAKLEKFEKNSEFTRVQQAIQANTRAVVEEWNKKLNMELLDEQDVYLAMQTGRHTDPARAARDAAKRVMAKLQRNNISGLKRPKSETNDPGVAGRNRHEMYFGEKPLPDIRKVGIDATIDDILSRFGD